MANERVMSGDLIRHHVTNAPISEDSIFYPIFKFLNYYSADIADLFHGMDMQDALNFLLKYDIENETIYKQYIK